MARTPDRFLSNLSLIICGLGIWAWSTWLYQYYFDFKEQDAFAMGVVMLAAGLIVYWLRDPTEVLHHDGALFALVILPFASWYILEWLISHTDHGWTFVYGSVVVTGIIIGARWRTARRTSVLGVMVLGVWLISFPTAKDQHLFYDKVVATQATRLGEIHRVQWRDDVWTYYNKQLSAASVDAHMYYEPLVHPAMHMAPNAPNVLLVGGDNGYALRELEKYKDATLTVVPYDAEFLKSSTPGIDVAYVGKEIFLSLTETEERYDLIIVDLPDPSNTTLNQYYSLEFYRLCHSRLTIGGLLVTQAGSPYLQPQIFASITKTIRAAEFTPVQLHNQVPSLGEWGWVIAAKREQLRDALMAVKPRVPTIWWDSDATAMMMSFGKEEFFHSADISVNSIQNPSLLKHRVSKR